MQLDRANMTRASRIMLPVYVVVFFWLGLNFTLTDKSRLAASPTLRYADNYVVNLRALGILLLFAALLLLIALLTKRRDAARYTLMVAGICFTILFFIFLTATFKAEASPSAAAWPFLGVAGCAASYRSITAYEVQ